MSVDTAEKVLKVRGQWSRSEVNGQGQRSRSEVNGQGQRSRLSHAWSGIKAHLLHIILQEISQHV